MNTAARFDAEKFKADTRKQWDQHAKGWNDHGAKIGKWLHKSTDAMLAMAAIGPGAHVLDVAAGAGDQTLDIAKRVGPTGSVLATDLSAAILAFAEENARRAGYANVTTKVADGENLEVPEADFDAAICRLGLMFFPIRAGRCAKCSARSSRADGRASSCFRRPTKILASAP